MSCVLAMFSFFMGIKTFQENSMNDITLMFFAGVLIFGFTSVLGILTYKDKCLLIDTNRWNNRGAWKNEGLKSKLKVISDWITE
ncbi:MAG: hypothetical protein H0W84_07945 [Bacteroidetes bacterium]|nr:hypothetical protein [Bacteroidota bacterium]